MRLLVCIIIGLFLLVRCSAEILPLIWQSSLFDVQDAEGEGAAIDVADSSGVPSISQSPSLELSESLEPSLSGIPSLGPSTTLVPSQPCYELWIELQYDDYASLTSFELISIDQGIIVPRQYGTIYEDDGQTRKEFVCLEPGQYQFTMHDSWGYGFRGTYNLKLQNGETIIDRNRDGLNNDDPTVPGFGEIVKFDLPFVPATLTSETLGALPTTSPTPLISSSPSGEHHSPGLIFQNQIQPHEFPTFKKRNCLV